MPGPPPGPLNPRPVTIPAGGVVHVYPHPSHPTNWLPYGTVGAPLAVAAGRALVAVPSATTTLTASVATAVGRAVTPSGTAAGSLTAFLATARGNAQLSSDSASGTITASTATGRASGRVSGDSASGAVTAPVGTVRGVAGVSTEAAATGLTGVLATARGAAERATLVETGNAPASVASERAFALQPSLTAVTGILAPVVASGTGGALLASPSAAVSAGLAIARIGALAPGVNTPVPPFASPGGGSPLSVQRIRALQLEEMSEKVEEIDEEELLMLVLA